MPNNGMVFKKPPTPFDYLTKLERQADALPANPQNWMLWSYRETLAAATPPTAR